MLERANGRRLDGTSDPAVLDDVGRAPARADDDDDGQSQERATESQEPPRLHPASQYALRTDE